MRASRLAAALAARIPRDLRKDIAKVVSPAMGGVIIGHEMGRALGVDALFIDEAHAFKNLFFFTEIENVRIAVERAVQLRSLAMESAGAYIREMALTYQTGSAVTSAMLDAQVKTSSALTDYYKAQLEGREFQY